MITTAIPLIERLAPYYVNGRRCLDVGGHVVRTMQPWPDYGEDWGGVVPVTGDCIFCGSTVSVNSLMVVRRRDGPQN